MSESNNIISKHLDKINKNTENLIFRGQSSHKWKLESSFHRRFKASFNKEPSYENFIQYNKDLIEKAKLYKYNIIQENKAYNLSDIELLADLQHYGASTGLLDFSTDFLVAMWFASEENGKMGKFLSLILIKKK